MKSLLSIMLAFILVTTACAYPLNSPSKAPLPLDGPVAELSLEPQTVEGEIIAEEPCEEVAAEETPGITWGGTTTAFKNAVKGNPAIWGVLGLILSVCGYRAGKGGVYALYQRIKDNVSPGEIGGQGMFLAGCFSVTNALAMGFNWSYLIANLIVGGCLAMIMGAGIASKSGDLRKKKESRSRI